MKKAVVLIPAMIALMGATSCEMQQQEAADALTDDVGKSLVVKQSSTASRGPEAVMKDDDELPTKDSMMEEDDHMMGDDEMMEDDYMGDAMMESDDDNQADLEPQPLPVQDPEPEHQTEVREAGQYQAYRDGVIGNGEESVLFFAAAWCPSCQANDQRLSSWFPGEAFVNVYKIDYDTAGELKSRFGIVQQDTFVRIDGNGNQVDATSFPSTSRLTAIISRN